MWRRKCDNPHATSHCAATHNAIHRIQSSYSRWCRNEMEREAGNLISGRRRKVNGAGQRQDRIVSGKYNLDKATNTSIERQEKLEPSLLRSPTSHCQFPQKLGRPTQPTHLRVSNIASSSHATFATIINPPTYEWCSELDNPTPSVEYNRTYEISINQITIRLNSY
ncbi:uncharacterized protein LOC122567239 [Bombus pyrosoma]|uniref:uncharacterized protein LOC122567239 n=1 Tax=Bombus pyrosoma TaxID=396416 RepID=UPI001CB8C549|nr:uncharacterized protein LOC122567239 [Bombus pyrosoma]XP_043581547.1 uncharacterized protein LOC122567239 [Bombus pyrosoma]